MQIEGLELYPFGSRTKVIHHTIGDDYVSDYDYAAQYSEEAKRILEAEGFEPNFSSEYVCENLTVMVYQKDNVDVVLKSDLERFKRVWDSIDSYFFELFIWKNSPYYKDMHPEERSFCIARVIEQLFRTECLTRKP